MKKRKINLIINREDYQKYQEYFILLRKIVIGLFLIFFLTFFYFLISVKNLDNKINDLKLEKTTLLKIINQNIDKYAKINYLKLKYFDLKDFLKDDAGSFFYYELLNNALKESSESAIIKEFNINKQRDINFTISFSNFSSLKNFFQFIESEKFLKNFEEIFLKNFLVIGKTENKEENYELSFYGRFLPYEKILKNNNETKN